MQEEEEFSISLFLSGDTIYNFIDSSNSNSCWVCINCHKTLSRTEEDISSCPNCYLNTLISINTRSTFQKLNLVWLREKIIISVLDMFEDSEY